MCVLYCYFSSLYIRCCAKSELANSLKAIADREAEAGVHFKIVETGGISIKSILQRSNPLETPGCDRSDCLPCKQGRGEGGQCQACGIQYQVECQLCPEEQKAVYIGESSRNLYTRSLEHISNYRTGTNTSFIIKHQNAQHRGQEPVFMAKVTGRTRDCLTRQVTEAVLIRRSQVPVLNSKSEWHQPGIYRVQQEVERG